jgi:hypothetical protein
MKIRLVCLAIPLALIASLVFGSTALAAKGTPDTPDFGYGAQIHLEGNSVGGALAAAKALKLDWVQIDFNWAAHWPAAQASPDLSDLDQAMLIAGQDGLAVLISLTNAPAWATSTRGPDPQITAQLVAGLAKRYPASLKGIELFPAANTVIGWGALPNPTAYLNLYHTAADLLHANNLDVNLVAAGLTPLPPDALAQDMDDLAFLDGLYAAGAADQVSILSLRFDDLTGDTLQAPGAGSRLVLRHYEEVRQVMLAHGHTDGILWITHFRAPSGKIQPADKTYMQPANEAAWLGQAFRQMRAQLYIGAAFVADLNPASADDAASLIGRDGNRRPFVAILGQLIDQNNQPLETSAVPAVQFIKSLLGFPS